ncbi:hypothetical protein ANN_22584, partial [Periplaneta americana]
MAGLCEGGNETPVSLKAIPTAKPCRLDLARWLHDEYFILANDMRKVTKAAETASLTSKEILDARKFVLDHLLELLRKLGISDNLEKYCDGSDTESEGQGT